MNQLLETSRSIVVVNNVPGPWITYKKGLRQEDALSPYLFLLVADVMQMDQGGNQNQAPANELSFHGATIHRCHHHPKADEDSVHWLKHVLDCSLHSPG